MFLAHFCTKCCLLYSVTDQLSHKLQVIQNAAVHVVMGARQFNHIPPVLHELCWLPVCQRTAFKLAITTYKCLHGLAPWVDACGVPRTWPTTACQFRPWRADSTSACPPENKRLQSPVQSSGTLCPQPSESHC